MRDFLRKYWPLFAIIAILIVIVGMSKYADSAKNRYENATGKAQAASVAKDQDSKAKNDAAQSYHPPVWAKYVSFPEGVGAWAVILTLLAIVWQSIETRASAIATADAANAAYESVTFAQAQLEMTRDKERARLEVIAQHNALEVEVAGDDLVHLIATVSIRNIGATKAFIGRTSGTLITKLSNEELEESSDYDPIVMPEQFIDPDKPAIPARVYFFPFDITASAFADCLEKGAFSLHFYGFIEYETLGLWRRKEFGYDWEIISRNSMWGGLYGLSDPYPNSPRPARDRITYGYWRLNAKWDKPEYLTSGKQESDEQETRPEPHPGLWSKLREFLEKLADENQD